MTALAGRRKSRCLMVGISCAVVIRRVTTVTILRKVIALAVASAAIEALMGALQRPELGVVKIRAFPALGPVSMADHAICGKTGLSMVRIVGVIVVIQMAGDTGLVGAGINAVLMTVRAGGLAMTSFENEFIVVKIRAFPALGTIAMAGHAIRREARVLMNRVGRAVIVIKMAVDACGGKAGVLAAFMTIQA